MVFIILGLRYTNTGDELYDTTKTGDIKANKVDVVHGDKLQDGVKTGDIAAETVNIDNKKIKDESTASEVNIEGLDANDVDTMLKRESRHLEKRINVVDDSLTGKIGTNRETIVETNTELYKTQKDLDAAYSEVNSNIATVEKNIQNDVNEINKNNTALSYKVDSNLSDLNERMDRLEDINKDVLEKLELLLNTRDNDTALLNDVKERMKEMETLLDVASSSIVLVNTGMDKLVDDIEENAQRIEDINATVEVTNSLVDVINTNVVDMNNTNTDIQQTLTTTNNRLVDLNDSYNIVSRVVNETIRELEEVNNTVEETIVSLDAITTEVNNTNTRISAVNENVTVLNTAIENTTRQVSEINTSIASSIVELDEVKTTIANNTNNIKTTNGRVNTVETTVGVLNTTLVTTTTDIDALENATNVLTEDVDVLVTRTTDNTSRSIELTEEVAALSETIENIDNSKVMGYIDEINHKLNAAVENIETDIGSMSFFTTPTCPAGWHALDGSEVPSSLTNSIGNTYPNLYGYFLRVAKPGDVIGSLHQDTTSVNGLYLRGAVLDPNGNPGQILRTQTHNALIDSAGYGIGASKYADDLNGDHETAPMHAIYTLCIRILES
jgi:chromosome segregation ATPase